MENIEESMPGCALKCLRNVEDTSQSVHKVKYGVNTIGRGLNNDIILKNLNVSRTHCHLRVEKKESKDIAYIKDLGTSNGTIVGNINLIQFEEHQLNDLDMIVLASGDEGVVLQYIDKIDRTINFSNLCNNNKRKVLCEENLDDESTAVKIPKLVINESEQNLLKKPFSNANTNPSNSLNNLPNVANNLQQAEHKNQLELVDAFFKTYQDFGDQKLPVEDPKIIPNSTEPSYSKYNDNISNSVKIKIEPDTIINNVFSQGTYRDEEDSVVYCISDEENDINDNGLELSNNKIEKQEQMNTSSTKHSCPSTSKIENNLNFPELSFQCQRNEKTRDDIDDVIYIPPNMNSDNINTLISSSDSESDYNSKCPKIIEPFPMKVNKRGQTKSLVENKYIIKTRAKSEKIIHSKKKAEEVIVDQNKQIIQERQMRLKKLATNNSINKNASTNDNFIDKPSTIGKLKKKSRISRLEQINNDNCIPSTSKSHLPILEVDKKVRFNSKEITSTINNQIEQFSFSNYKNIDSSTTKIIKPINFAFFDTLSRICKWNAVWLYEEKFADASPPLVKNIYKMKEQFDTPSEYSSTMNSVLFYEIWSKISESYHMVLSKNPNLEQSIFEKSSKKNLPLPTFGIQSVNKEFSTSVPALKSINQPLWCLKCIGTNKNIETLTVSRNSLKGCLCIVIVQSNCFGTDIVGNKKPTKSRNIFFGYVNMTKKIGYHSNSQFYMELIITKKTENIPNGTHIQLMDIFYLLSELRLFQAINNVTTSTLCKALITPQLHNYSIDSSKANSKNYNINSLLLNNSQKEAVKMAVTICNAVEPNVGLIIGPPGTGKTNVICNIILSLMSKQLTKTTTKPKLLICAPSNEAADAIVRRIIEIKKDLKHESQFNVVRVGSGQKYDPNSPIADVMLDTVIKQKMGNPLNEANQQCQSNNLFIYTNKKDLENEILINTEVIVTTLNSCFSKTMEEAFKPSNIKSLNNCHFTACIVDEAGQSIEPLIFVPILLGIDKLILVGDDKQLQPLVKSKVAKDNGLGISLFKRLKTWFEQKRSTRKSFPVTMLNTQYRMHYEICLFPSKYFYKGEIKTAPSVKMRKQLSFHPYMILEHESLQDNTGEVNIGEANMIVTLVDILLNSECRSLTIAVLTPYHKQREQINILLKKKKISLNVNTIDSFQGGECDVLLISTVRTNGVGFMDDICRLNVALTRAKQSLIICGNFMSLRGERVWSDLIEDAKERKLIKKVSKKVMTNSKVLLAMIKL
ncbi:uncharacterized protein LOC132943378 isoform X3 [Metopolophium dirhodum]|nr:uncharacterized protein LOC132943378 isoform X3 [Metopolophium dirhodum]XP_060868333.1 uncharacterized protein LOC132943378 isoform X3 [Metopolophium dirhodum]XP_060868334.1 uncharacterized protein LOC132943378 isoform X3 [Metopolophium dirhodum]